MTNGVSVQSRGVYDRIRRIIENARGNIAHAINAEMVVAYWQIGREIVEEEQKGKSRADYGKKLLEGLAKRLSDDFGKGFDDSNLWNMRKFYQAYPILDAVRRELSWTHYRVLMRVEKPEARSFYEIECVKNNWSARELERQKGSLLFERLALSKDKKGLMRLAQKGQELNSYKEMIKDPYVLEFTGLSAQPNFYENKLEQALIDNLSRFLLELGRGFTFVARQKRISLREIRGRSIRCHPMKKEEEMDDETGKLCPTCKQLAKEHGHLCVPATKKDEKCDWCGSLIVNERHLCKDKVQALSYICNSCGRAAVSADYLCKPSKI